MQDNTVTQKIENLRSQILNELVPLVEQGSGDAFQKFELFLAVARASGDPDKFTRAFEASKALESNEDRTQALFVLLEAMEDLDFQFDEVDQSTPVESPAPVSEQAAEPVYEEQQQ